MRLYLFLLSLILTTSTVSNASAAEFKISVKSSLTLFVMNEYVLNNDFQNARKYYVEDINDPLLENFPVERLIKGATTQGGSIHFKEVFYEGSYFSSGWRPSNCKGVFEIFNCSHDFDGILTDSSINLVTSDTYDEYFGIINTAHADISVYSQDTYYWTNVLGGHSVLEGESMVHRIDQISISQVPVPASGLLMLLSLVGLGGARMMRRR